MANLYTREANKMNLAISGAEKLNENDFSPSPEFIEGNRLQRLSHFNALESGWRPCRNRTYGNLLRR